MGLVGAASASAALALEGGLSVRIGPGDSVSPYIRFRTMQGASFHASHRVTLMWRGVPKATATNGATVYGAWKTVSKTVAASSFTTKAANGLTEWALPLSAVATVSGTWSAAGDWKFDNRLYDELDFRATVEPLGSDGASSGPAGTAEAWLGYVPAYAVSSIDYDLDSVNVTLSRTASWLRTDDRWALDGGRGKDTIGFSSGWATPSSEVWGQVGAGKVAIPTSCLTRRPSGSWCTITLRINSSFKALGMALTYAKATKAAMADHTVCDTPKVEATASGIRVSDSGDKGVPITRAKVSLAGSGYGFDTVELTSLPGTAAFKLPPASGTYEVTASGASDSRSSTVSAAWEPGAGGMSLMDMDTGEVFELDAEPGFSLSYAQEATVEKLAGRELESAWFGTGGTESASVSATLWGEGMAGRAERLLAVRRCLLRTPDGVRRLMAPTKATRERGANCVTVSLDLEGVTE
jgi:hypothetical protein